MNQKPALTDEVHYVARFRGCVGLCRDWRVALKVTPCRVLFTLFIGAADRYRAFCRALKEAASPCSGP